tara:strand:- start:2627 stop:3322 length:696 start_codon:yes stop_codon:yes gene_type:complete
MDLFYSKYLNEHKLSLEESKHCLSSLRKKIYEKILITDGKGCIYMSKIEAVDNGQVVYDDLIPVYKHELTKKLHIAIAPTKNKTRFEWLLEKVTEIGVDSISPIICDHSERKKINQLRCEKVLISAMKQSKNAILPKLNKPMSFQSIVKNCNKHTYIAHCYNTPKHSLKNLLLEIKKPEEITLFIGPEGDFSKKELNFAQQSGLIEVSLGEQRLRTETAAIVGCYMIQSLI